MSAPGKRFTPAQRALHWLMAACILAMLFIGVGMVSTVEPVYLTLVSIHEPLGLTILALAIVRVVLRFKRGAPPLPVDMPEPMRLAAKASHVVFYVLMFALLLLGWSMLSAADYPIVILGAHLPRIAPVDPVLHATLWNAHRFLALCFFALILVHLAAGLYHALVRRDGVFEAMAPTGDRSLGVGDSTRGR